MLPPEAAAPSNGCARERGRKERGRRNVQRSSRPRARGGRATLWASAMLASVLTITHAAIAAPAVAAAVASTQPFPGNAAERLGLERRQMLDDSGQRLTGSGGPSATAFVPVPRHAHCAFVESAVLYILGGTSDVGGTRRNLPSRQNFFAWDPIPTDGSRPERVRWSRVSENGFRPVFGQTCTVVPESRHVIVLGRNRPEDPFMQVFDLSTQQWLAASNFTPYPGSGEPSLCGHVAGLLDDSHIVVSGGQWVGQGRIRYGKRSPNPFTFILDVRSWEWVWGSLGLELEAGMSALTTGEDLEKRWPLLQSGPQAGPIGVFRDAVQPAPMLPVQHPPSGLMSAASWVHAGRLYVAGGSQTAGSFSKPGMPTAWSYGLEDGWQAEPALNYLATGVSGMACATVNETTILCDGGRNETKSGDKVPGGVVDFSSFPPKILPFMNPPASSGVQGHTLDVLQDGTLVAFGGLDASSKPQNKLLFMTFDPPAFSWQYPVKSNSTDEPDDPDSPTQPEDVPEDGADGLNRNLTVYALLATIGTLFCAFAAVCLGGKVSARRQGVVVQRPLMPAMRQRDSRPDADAGFTTIGSSERSEEDMEVEELNDNGEEPVEVLRSASRQSTEDDVVSDRQSARFNHAPTLGASAMRGVASRDCPSRPLTSPAPRGHLPWEPETPVPVSPRPRTLPQRRPPLGAARALPLASPGGEEVGNHRSDGYLHQNRRASEPSGLKLALVHTPSPFPGCRPIDAEPRGRRFSQPFASSPLARMPPRTMTPSSSRSGSSGSGSGDNEGGDMKPLHGAAGSAPCKSIRERDARVTVVGR